MKFYVVTRQDLTEAQQAVQSTHVAIDYCLQHPTQAGPWHRSSNYLVLLGAKDEEHLLQLHQRCNELGINSLPFREPDLNNTITALAIEPISKAKRVVKRLPLILNK